MKIQYITKSDILDISQIKTEVKISGDKDSKARKLSMGYLAAKNDLYMPRITLENGNAIKITEDEEVLFFGYITSVSVDENSDTASITAYDPLFYLKNKTVENIQNSTPEKITKKLCGKFNIPVKSLETTNASFSKVYVENSIYEIIKDAYSRAGEYNIRYDNGLIVEKTGIKKVELNLNSYENISTLNHTEDIESMVNRVLITDNSGTDLGKVENADQINKYGLFQETAKSKEDADKLLKGTNATTNISVYPGNTALKTGNKVRVKTNNFDLDYIIISDEHTWSNEVYQTNLTLLYKES